MVNNLSFLWRGSISGIAQNMSTNIGCSAYLFTYPTSCHIIAIRREISSPSSCSTCSISTISKKWPAHGPRAMRSSSPWMPTVESLVQQRRNTARSPMRRSLNPRCP